MTNLPSFEPLIALFAEYSNAMARGFSPEQILLAQEANGTLSDLHYLLQEVIALNSVLVERQGEQARKLIDSLRQAGTTDPEFAKFLRDNPNLELSGLSAAYSLGLGKRLGKRCQEPFSSFLPASSRGDRGDSQGSGPLPAGARQEGLRPAGPVEEGHSSGS